MTGGWTKGPWKASKFSSVVGCAISTQPDPKKNTVIIAGVHGSFGDDYRAEVEANAALIAEAGTVANETGLTPRQLADQRAELLAALEFYGELTGWNQPPVQTSDHEIFGKAYQNQASKIQTDRGKLARAVIAKCTGAA